MKIETIACDIRGCECQGKNEVKPVNDLQVIFTTEQTEGRGVTHYLSKQPQIDLCADHYHHLMNGNYIFASGAMGHNQYWFKNNDNEQG